MTSEPSTPSRRVLVSLRPVLCAVAVATAAPAAAYVPPATAILKRAVQHRDELHLSSVEVRGTLSFSGPAAERVRAAGLDAGAALPATFLLKVPGRCRLELAPPGVAAAQRPAVSTRAGRVTGTRGLPDVAAARALVEAVCALLGDRGTPGEPERGIVQRLGERGVDVREVTLGRWQGRVAWVIGGKPQDGRPQAWVDKQAFDPVRLISPVGGALHDVRFVAAGTATERFPRNVEVWSGGQLLARFSADVVTPNPKLPDAAFP